MYYNYYIWCFSSNCNQHYLDVLPVVYAQSSMFTPGYVNIANLLLNIIAILVIIIFGGSLYSFLYGIFLLIFSKGSEENLKKAFNSFRFALLGILLTLFLLFIFPFVLQKLGIPQSDQFTADKVFQKASYIIRFIFFRNDTTNTQMPDTLPSPTNLPIEL